MVKMFLRWFGIVFVMMLGCGEKKESVAKTQEKSSTAPEQPLQNLQKGLLLALSQFEVDAHGKVLAKPGPAKLEMVRFVGGKWVTTSLQDAQSNVFHKAQPYNTANGEAILTLGGTQAMVKLWTAKKNTWDARVLWKKDFGGKFSRMRDAEVADLFGDASAAIAVATHDQGAVAVLRPRPTGEFEVIELDHRKDTFVHEIEIGDLNGDGVREVYATPSEPNRLDGSVQTGRVVRYTPAKKEGPTVVADLGQRHAKEILVRDMNNDGKDELYVSVEGETQGEGASMQVQAPVEIRRYAHNTPPDQGVVIATIQDRLCRFLTAGDVDGDGKKEMVAAAFRSGLWLLRPSEEADNVWSAESIDRASSGFEHAALLADLDGDQKDELYVASDDQGELRRYVWRNGGFQKEVLFERPIPGSVFTWNIMTASASLLRSPN